MKIRPGMKKRLLVFNVAVLAFACFAAELNAAEAFRFNEPKGNSIQGDKRNRSRVFTYPMPPEIEPSKRYSVRVRSKGLDWQSSPVYRSTDQLNLNREAAWTTFSFVGIVEIEITVLQASISNVTVRPKAYQIEPRFQGSQLNLQLNRPRKLCVEVNDSDKHPLLIFADPLEIDPPSEKDEATVCFEPGLHNIGDRYKLKSHTTYYLAGGAYLKGSFYGSGVVTNVTIRGRGILDSGYQKWNHPIQGMQSNISFEDGRNVRIRGITLIEAGNFQIKHQVKVPNTTNVFQNLKLIGWNKNSDGIHISDMDWKDHPMVGNAAGTGIEVSDCFIMANDDCVLICDGVAQSKVEDCVFWDLGYGATICLSWGGHQDVQSATVKRCHVIHKEGRNPVFRARHAGEAEIRNVLIEDLTVEGNIAALVGLRIMDHRYDRDPGHGSIHDVMFRNITVEGNVQRNWIQGYDEQAKIERIHFENLEINGRPILDPDSMPLQINQYASDIQFR